MAKRAWPLYVARFCRASLDEAELAEHTTARPFPAAGTAGALGTEFGVGVEKMAPWVLIQCFRDKPNPAAPENSVALWGRMV